MPQHPPTHPDRRASFETWEFCTRDHVSGVPLDCLLCSSTRDIYQAPGESSIGLKLCKQPLFLFLQWWRSWDLERSSSLPKAFTAPVRCYSSKKDMSVLQGWRNSDKDWKCPLSSEWQRHSWSHIDRNTGTWKPREIWVGASRTIPWAPSQTQILVPTSTMALFMGKQCGVQLWKGQNPPDKEVLNWGSLPSVCMLPILFTIPA